MNSQNGDGHISGLILWHSLQTYLSLIGIEIPRLSYVLQRVLHDGNWCINFILFVVAEQLWQCECANVSETAACNTFRHANVLLEKSGVLTQVKDLLTKLLENRPENAVEFIAE